MAELFETDRVVPVVVFLRRGEAPRALRLGGVRREGLIGQRAGLLIWMTLSIV